MAVTFAKDLQNIWPVSMGSASWRFGALGFFLGTGAVPVIGLAMIILSSVLGEWRKMLVAAGVLGVALGVLMLGGLVLFLVDSQSISASAGGDAVAMVAGAVRRTMLIGSVAGVTYLVLGIAGFKALNRFVELDEKKLVVGS